MKSGTTHRRILSCAHARVEGEDLLAVHVCRCFLHRREDFTAGLVCEVPSSGLEVKPEWTCSELLAM